MGLIGFGESTKKALTPNVLHGGNYVTHVGVLSTLKSKSLFQSHQQLFDSLSSSVFTAVINTLQKCYHKLGI